MLLKWTWYWAGFNRDSAFFFASGMLLNYLNVVAWMCRGCDCSISFSFYLLQVKAIEDSIGNIKSRLFDIMSEVCDLLGSVSIDDWLSMPDKVTSTIQRLLLRRLINL
jgi:hypothetical protein